MNKTEHRQLLTRIPREAWHQVKVKAGCTNGRLCIHIRDTQPKNRRRASTTIYTMGEWLVHPLNKLNKPTAKREQSLDEYVKTFVQETARIQAVSGRLTPDNVAAATDLANE